MRNCEAGSCSIIETTNLNAQQKYRDMCGKAAIQFTDSECPLSDKWSEDDDVVKQELIAEGVINPDRTPGPVDIADYIAKESE